MVIPDQWVWLVWSNAFLVPWAILFVRFPRHRRAMLWASAFTAPFGLTEPLFVPEYWNPPSLFDLASTTGFDIESVIFSFGIGGVGAVLYNVLTHRGLEPVGTVERQHGRHRWHRWAILVPILVFPPLYLLPWNPIYPGIAAMILGAVATTLCRPDLKPKVLFGSAIFVAYYMIFLLGLRVTAPGYIERVWNLGALSGIGLVGCPVEELLFAIGFGAYWSGVYEHVTWHQVEAR